MVASLGLCAGFICIQKQASLLCLEDEFHSNGASGSFKTLIIAIPHMLHTETIKECSGQSRSDVERDVHLRIFQLR